MAQIDTYCDLCGKWLTEQVLTRDGLFCEECWETKIKPQERGPAGYNVCVGGEPTTNLKGTSKMRTTKNTGISKRAAEEMMREAARTAAAPLGDSTRQLDLVYYLNQLTATYLTQDQMMAIEGLLDLAFDGGKAAAKLGE